MLTRDELKRQLNQQLRKRDVLRSRYLSAGAIRQQALATGNRNDAAAAEAEIDRILYRIQSVQQIIEETEQRILKREQLRLF